MPTTLTKFCEGGWRFIFYSVMFTYGLGVLYNKPWMWDVGACWEQYPYHTVGWDIWLWYMIGQWDILRKYFLNVLYLLQKLDSTFPCQ